MERTLLLEISGFPAKFDNIDVNPPIGLSKKDYAEQQVLKYINIYNPKLNVTKVEYAGLKTQFTTVYPGKFTGLIVEDIKIQQAEEEKFKNEGYFVWVDNNKWFARKIVIYVFLSPTKEESRNSLFTQSIFPEVIEYMNDFLLSPSYTIANHPIYFINIINKHITSNMLLKRLAGFISAQLEYIEVFPGTINAKTVPSDIEGFIKTYEKSYIQGQSFSSDYYSVDFTLKKLTLSTKKLVVGESLVPIITTGKLGFKGSEEKFYWAEILPIIILACRNGYDVDYSKLEHFYNSNIGNFGVINDDKKFQRFLKLLQYIKKISFS